MIRYHRAYPGRNEDLLAVGMLCRCGTCLCCRLARLLRRIERARRNYDRRTATPL